MTARAIHPTIDVGRALQNAAGELRR